LGLLAHGTGRDGVPWLGGFEPHKIKFMLESSYFYSANVAVEMGFQAHMYK